MPAKFVDLNPKMLPRKEPRNTNLTSLSPEHMTFSNKLFRNAYASYYSYLNWSLSNDFISLDGFHYKLNSLITKLNTNLNDTYNEMLANLDSDSAKDSLIYKVLFESESTSFFGKLDKDSLLDEYFRNSSTNSSDIVFRFRKRKLLDTFADSLRHVNRMFNQIYGYMARKVPAHMPHFIDRQIMRRLQMKFRAEFEKTSANRLRTSTDMQYSFTYYYYVISEMSKRDAGVLFDELDLNMNGYLDESELMLVSLKVSARPFSSNKFVPHEASANEMYSLNRELAQQLDACKKNHTDNKEAHR